MAQTLYFRYDDRQLYRITEHRYEMVDWLCDHPLIIRHEDYPRAIRNSDDLRELQGRRPEQRMSPDEYQAGLERALTHPDVQVQRDP